MLSLNHKKLDVWNVSIDLTCDIYELTNLFPSNERFLLTNQIRRAAISIASNIAEGCSREHMPDRRRFFVIARSSSVEIDTQIEIAVRIGYLKKENLLIFKSKFIRLFSMLSKLIASTYR